MSDYIKDMRKLVGKRALLQCGASTIILDKDNRVLLLRRADNNSWCFPGGAVELGEKTEVAASREIKEETGLIVEVEDLKLLNVFSGCELHYIYPNGDEVYNIDVVYVTNKYKGKIKMDNESKEYAFFDISDFPEDISPPVVPVVEYLKESFSRSPLPPQAKSHRVY